MQDLAKRNEANNQNPIVGEKVWVGGAVALRGIVTGIVSKSDQTSYQITLEDGTTTRRLRREIVRVIQ